MDWMETTLWQRLDEIVTRTVGPMAARCDEESLFCGESVRGIRFPACDFAAGKLPTALGLAKKARAGDKDAIEQIISIITNGLLNEQLL